MMFYRFVVASAFVILSFASSVTGQGACIPRPCTNVPYKASIGISEVENYLPVINRQQNNLTNYNAKNLSSRISFDVPVRSLTLRTTFKWTHNGAVLVAGNSSRVHVNSSNGALNIFYSKLEDEGAYQFFMSNELGTMFARKFWIKFAVSGAFLRSTNHIIHNMTEGEPFVLPCPPRAYSYPRPEYDWISETGQVISNSFGPRILMEPNGDLLFSYVDASDFNTFMNPKGGVLSPVRCRARGVSYILTGPPVYFRIDSATMSPSSPVRFYTKPQGVYTVLTGDQLYLNCTAGGRPVPEIFWYQNGRRINDFGDFFLLQNFNRTLRLGSLHRVRHDGLYACEAVGNLETKEEAFKIKVLDKVTAVYSGRSDQLEFRAGQHNGNVKMFCYTTGHGIIKRTWYYNGVEMKDSAKFSNRWSVDEHGILEIRQLQLKDFGVFQCVAKNPVSEGDRRTYLVVTGAPLPPINVQLTDCSNHSTTITWDLRFPLDILPRAFIIEWRLKPNASHSMLPELAFSKLAEIPGSNRSYLVNNLEPWRYIEFRMRAKNSLGEGFPSKVLGGCITGAKKLWDLGRSLFAMDFRSVHTAVDGIIFLRWTALDPQDWNGDNCKYIIFYRRNVSSTLWNNATLTSNCNRSSYILTKLQLNSEYELRIRVENVKGLRQISPVIKALSGQTTPPAPAKVTVVGVDPSSVEVEWTAIQVSSPKTVDGYWVLAAVGSLSRSSGESGELTESPPLSRRKNVRRGLPEIASTLPKDTIFVHVQLNTSLRGVVTGLRPWTTYTLAVAGYNNAGTGSWNYQRVTTIDSSEPRCSAETIQGVAWSTTAQGGTDIQPCPSGASGSATRECSIDATWKNQSFTGCNSPVFSRLQDEVEAITRGYQSNTRFREVLPGLVNATHPITNDTTRPSQIYGGDLLVSVKILVRLAEYNNASQGNISSEEDVHNFVTVVSNLLDPGNTITWQNLEQEGNGISRTLIKVVDSYGLGVAATLNRTTKSRTFETKNLLMRITRVTRDGLLKNEGLKVSYQKSSIQLPSEAFGSNYSHVVSVIYLTLNDVISLRRGKYENVTSLPNTTVVSSTVFPPPRKNFIEPVKIVLQNKRVSVPSGAAFKTTCVFWRPGGSSLWETRGCELVPSESDANKTTCNCDHLTIFASLMDLIDSNVGEAHRKALEMISIVGCSISLIAVLVTIVVSLIFWRAIKSPRAKVLLNLCIAIALSCIFVISEGFARDNKVGCIVVAALLHYFLLAMFSWMLCEGVFLYILLVKVFGGGPEEKVKYFYISGWGFPAIIVAISLAATQTVGYGTAHACWLDISSGLIWAFIAPVISIILVNIVVFILVFRKMMGTRHMQNKTQIEKVKAGIKASAVILPLLGITWLFGLLAFNSATIAFKYIFAIANSLQGFMIFIFHCLLNKQIRDAIKRMRDRSSPGLVPLNPKSKPSPKPQEKSAVKQLQRVSKKKSIRAHKDYELVDMAAEGSEDLSVGNRELSTRPAVAKCGKTGEAPSSATERAELKQHDNVRNEEDFEVKKEERKETIDTVQGDEEAFKLSGNKNVNVISQSAGTRIREIFHRGGFNVS
ncbi:uncharacterized protein LOC114947269 isoform X3 [Acropora millepora]|uniref:uncharacterized protein LOC114947269 isoform X3 n=1 Tax=Acropora millepora TaxID=45264 RepID=UPI001CF420B7|nr:uncharacterized protein LOC114947269 isoform X3 [Acropora millepora]